MVLVDQETKGEGEGGRETSKGVKRRWKCFLGN